MNFLEHVEMPEAEFNDALQVMVTGNSKLKVWADTLFGKRKRKVFRKMILDNDFDPAAHTKTPEDCQALQADLLAMRAVKGYEFQIAQHFAMLMSMEAKRFAETGRHVGLEKGDLESEAYMATVDAVWGYTDENIQLITFVTAAIRNKFATAASQANPLGNQGNYYYLIEKFEATKLSFNGPCNWEEIVEKMGLDEDGRSLLRSIQAGSHNVSDRPATTGTHLCYTEWGTPVADLDESDLDEGDLATIIKKANLSEFELAVVLGTNNPTPGWKKEVAAQFPMNGKTPSRTTVYNVLNKAMDKLRRAA